MCCAKVGPGASGEYVITDELAEILFRVPAASFLLDASLEHNQQRVLPELATRLVGVPLVVQPCPDGACKIVLYDSAEEPTSKEGVEGDIAKWLERCVSKYWSS